MLVNLASESVKLLATSVSIMFFAYLTINTATYCWSNFLAIIFVQFHSIFIPLGSDTLACHLTSFMSFDAVSEWLWRLIQKQTYFQSVSCCKAMVISRSLKVWHSQILAPFGFCMTRHSTKIVVIALEIKSPYLSILSVVFFPAQLQLISFHSYIIIMQAIWPELRLCQHFHYKHLVSKAL